MSTPLQVEACKSCKVQFGHEINKDALVHERMQNSGAGEKAREGREGERQRQIEMERYAERCTERNTQRYAEIQRDNTESNRGRGE